jgi:outer membrane protein OmpA-like peptidoglycan-associated protein
MRPASILTAVLLLAAAALSFAQTPADSAGCKDSPYVSRMPGTWISSCTDKPDDTLTFPVTENGKTANKTVEGKISNLGFRYPTSTVTKAQVVRNYSTALRQAGYQNMYDSGAYGDSTWKKGPLWIFVSISGSGAIDVDSVQEIALTQDVVATAAELGDGLNSNGHAVVPGILFDTGKAQVKDESRPALAEVAKLLNGDAALKLYVVGHTDNVGTAASNIDLSKRRAAAVIAMLVSQYHVAASRLDSFGAGPFAPVATNSTDAGRAQNRRVEIVKQ